jgi:hypothetical protein
MFQRTETKHVTGNAVQFDWPNNHGTLILIEDDYVWLFSDLLPIICSW